MFGLSQRVKAVVQKIEPGKHGEYVVCKSDGIEGSVTFGLDSSVWKGEWKPEPGEIVILSGLKRKRAGWRATNARPFRILDKYTTFGNEQPANIGTTLAYWKDLLGDSKTEAAWKRWVSYQRREWWNLKALLEDGEIADAFKARALFIILTPEVDWIPFSWNGTFIDKGLLSIREEMVYRGLSEDLLRFAAQLVEVFFIWAKERHHLGYPCSPAMLEAYNDQVIALLACLPSSEEESHVLFQLFELNDAECWTDGVSSSGYKPFFALMRNKEVLEVWKRAAEEKMRRIVLGEISGTTRPRREWESALRCYAYLVQIDLWGDGPQHLELFVDQVRFLLEVASAFGLKDQVFSPSHFRRIYDILLSADQGLLAQKFAWFMVFDNGRGFEAYDRKDLETLAHVLRHVPKGHSRLAQRLLAQRLKELIEYAAPRIREDQTRTVGEQEKEQAILAALKKS